MADTNKLGVPLIAADQSQKHVTHNDAMNRFDQMVHQTVINRTTSTPPVSPSDGHAYIIAATATGSWVGREGQIAARIGGAWTYFTPRAGWVVWDESAAIHVVYISGAWSPLFTTVGSVIDWADYNDAATTLSPISLPVADTFYDLTNDGTGPYTNTAYASTETAGIWDTVTQQFDFTGLSLGDTVDIRLDIVPTTGASNTLVTPRFDLAIGSGAPYSIPFNSVYYKTAGLQSNITFNTSIYIGDSNTRDNPAKLTLAMDTAGGSVVVNGWWYRVTKL